jgi:integrase
MVEYKTGQITPAMETAIRREVMRCAMMEWLVREASFEPRSIDEADAAAAAIETKVAATRAAIRLRDPSLALAPVAAAAAALGVAINPVALPRVGRAVLGVLAELHEAELAFESGATVEEATRVLREVHFGGRPPERLSPPVRLATAVAKAIERAPTRGMTDKVKTTGELMLAFFGADAFLDDVFTKERMIAFLAWCMRLPRLHGKAHGRNKYEKVGKAPSKNEEIDTADAHDAAVWAEIEAREDLTYREKLVLAGQKFEPRVTDNMIEKHHARAKAIHETARDCLDWDAAPWRSYLKDWRDEMARERRQTTEDAGNAHTLLRVTKPKHRSAWSDERVARLLNSTVYRGCFSEHRRWRTGHLIVRDHFYWAPLICLLCGLRPEEVLRLPKLDVFERDGILCFRVKERPESGPKTESSERVVPLPETLLRFDFRE